MTGSSMWVEARPVRSPDNSVLSTALAPCMRRLISLMSCVVAVVMDVPRTRRSQAQEARRSGYWYVPARNLADDGRASLATQNGLDRTPLGNRKDDDRHPVFPGKREGGGIHDPQILLNGLLVAQALVPLGFRVFLGVGGVNPVHAGGLQHCMALELGCPQYRGRVRGKERITRPGGQQYDAALAEIFHRALAVVGLANGRHSERGKGARLAPGPLDRAFQYQAVHHRRQHAQGVADRSVDTAFRQCYATEDVAAADHHAKLDAELRGRHKIGGDPLDGRLLDTKALRAGKRLAGQLDDDAPIERITHAMRSYVAVSFDQRRPRLQRRNPLPASQLPRQARSGRTRLLSAVR